MSYPVSEDRPKGWLLFFPPYFVTLNSAIFLRPPSLLVRRRFAASAFRPRRRRILFFPLSSNRAKDFPHCANVVTLIADSAMRADAKFWE